MLFILVCLQTLLEICTISFLWFLVLIGVFLNIRQLSMRHLAHRERWPFVHNLLAFAVTGYHGSILLQLLWECRLLYDHYKSPLWRRWLLTVQGEEDPHYLWRLNPLGLFSRTFQAVVVFSAGMVGHSAGAFIARLLAQIPWLLQLPVLILLAFLALSVVMTASDYSYSIGYGMLRIQKKKAASNHTQPNISRRKYEPMKANSDNKQMGKLYQGRLPSAQQPSLIKSLSLFVDGFCHKIEEVYQRHSPD